VRLRPRGRADVFDLELKNRIATVVSIQMDADGRAHVTVTIDDDPGSDLGKQGFIAHHFFFDFDEVETV
jgi:hypothetical protein